MKSIKDKIKKVYGWVSPTVGRELEQVERDIREDEYRRCTKLFLQILIDNLNLPVSALVERIRRGEDGYGSDNDAAA